MAKKLSTLTVDIRANSAKFSQGVGNAQKRMAGFQKSAKALTSTMLTLGGIAGIGFVIKKNLELADSIGKAADTVALNTDAYQELAQSAERAGIAQSQFTSNMTAFVKRVGEARANTGPLVSFLKKYDENLLKAIQSTKTQEEAFNLMSDAIARAKTETDRAALANAAFSRAGVRMTILMKNGAEGVEQMRQRVRELGTVMEEDFIRNAEAANDRVDELSKTLSIKLTSAVAGNAETIEDLSQALIDLIDGFGKVSQWAKEFGGSLADKPVTALDLINERIIETKNSINEANATITDRGILGFGGSTPEEIDAARVRLEGFNQALDTHLAIRQRLTENQGTQGEGEGEESGSGLSEIVASGMELEIEQTQEQKDKLTQLENDHWAEIDRIRRQNMSSLERFNERSWKGQTKTVLGQMTAMTQGVAQSSKTMFNINKAAALSEAVIAGFQGVAKTLGAYPYPINIGMAALSAAASAAQVSAIAGTSFGGGGSAPSLAGSGGGSTTVNTVDVTTPAAATASATLTVNLGDFDLAAISDTDLRTLMTKIEDARTDMGDNTQVIYA